MISKAYETIKTKQTAKTEPVVQPTIPVPAPVPAVNVNIPPTPVVKPKVEPKKKEVLPPTQAELDQVKYNDNSEARMNEIV